MTYLDALQWIGFALVVAGYWRFGKSIRQGAWISICGCVPLVAWAYIVGAWGVLALQIAVILINLKMLWSKP